MTVTTAPYFWDDPVGPGALHRAASTLTVSTTDRDGTDRTALLLSVTSGDALRLTADDGRWWSYIVAGDATLTPDAVANVAVTPGPQSQHASPHPGDPLTLTVWDADTPSTPTPTPHTASEWATIADVRGLWPDASVVDDVVLSELIAAATLVCRTFATPGIADDPTPPDVVTPEVGATRRIAVTLETREIWAASRRDGDVIGFDTYAVRVRPLSSSVQALLRPSRGRPVTG